MEPQEFDFIPGSSMTPEKMAALSRRLRETLAHSEVDGAVITHGTDTLEEAAPFRDLARRGVLFAQDLLGHKARLAVFLAHLR